MAKAMGVFRLGRSAPAGSRRLIAHVTARHSRSCRIRGFGCGRRGLAGGNAGGIEGLRLGEPLSPMAGPVFCSLKSPIVPRGPTPQGTDRILVKAAARPFLEWRPT